MTYMGTPLHRKPCPGGHEIYKFGITFHILYYTLSLSKPYPVVEKKIFQEIHVHQFFPFYLRMRGLEIYNFLSPYPKDASYQIWSRMVQQFLRKHFDVRIMPQSREEIHYRPPEGGRLYDMKVVSGYAFLRTYYVQKKITANHAAEISHKH